MLRGTFVGGLVVMRPVFLVALVVLCMGPTSAIRLAWGDGPTDSESPEPEAAWEQLLGSARFAAKLSWEATLWERRARRARTETWARYALDESQRSRGFFKVASETVARSWPEEGGGQARGLIETFQETESWSGRRSDSEEELLAVQTEAAAKYVVDRIKVEDEATSRLVKAVEEGNRRRAEFRLNYLAWRARK
jgi:hypothetical protein